MSSHLQEDEICRWMAGERDGRTEEHLARCARCRGHVARMADTLGVFQDSAHEHGLRGLARYDASAARQIDGRLRVTWRSLSAAGLVAAAGLAIAVWVPVHSTKVVAPVAQGQADDAVLLGRVADDVARTIPGPMEPLMKLIPSETGTEDR